MPLTIPTAQHVYIGAHLDDIILSCAGTIMQQVRGGESVAAVTVFAGSPTELIDTPLVQELHQRWIESFTVDTSRIDINAVRRGEDILAFATLSHDIEVEHYSLPDAIYRLDSVTGEPLYTDEDTIFGEIHPNDPALAQLSERPEVPAGTIVYSPLAIGNHVDHQIVRQAIEAWGLDPDCIRYYEDFPYVTGEEELEKVIDLTNGWQPDVSELDENNIQVKKEAVMQYVSQISTFWKDPDQLMHMLLTHSERTGGERFWVRSA